MDKPDWMADAACRGMAPELFFPPPGYPGHDGGPGKAVCRTCPVIRECLAYTMEPGKYEKVGVWGGLSEQERRNRRRRRPA